MILLRFSIGFNISSYFCRHVWQQRYPRLLKTVEIVLNGNKMLGISYLTCIEKHWSRETFSFYFILFCCTCWNTHNVYIQCPFVSTSLYTWNLMGNVVKAFRVWEFCFLLTIKKIENFKDSKLFYNMPCIYRKHI